VTLWPVSLNGQNVTLGAEAFVDGRPLPEAVEDGDGAGAEEGVMDV
jgi:hypothetical protein